MNIELESLLQPISDDHPCGEDLSFSNDFHEIKKARTQDDPLLTQGDWITEPKQADWNFVSNKTVDLLQYKTKDIRLLTWLSESWSHLYGYDGIAKSLELSHQLLEKFWINIHPEIDDDLDQRLGLLQGLINQLPNIIRSVPLINAAPFYSLFNYEQILHQQNNRLKQNDESTASPNADLEQFEQSVFNCPKNFQLNQYQSFQDLLKHWHRLKEILDQLMQLDAPSFANIDSQLDTIEKSLKKIYKINAFNGLGEQEATMASHIDDSSKVPGMPPLPATRGTTPFQPQAQSHIQNRDQAMKVLQEISDYFQANEPHSPVSYMLQKTIKWSQMPLHEWLAEVIKNEGNPLNSVQELLGVKVNNESNEW